MEVGEGAGEWSAGDRVCALLAGGGYAQYAAAPAPQCLPIPRGLDAVQAAALQMPPEMTLPTSSIEQQRPLAVNVTITQSAILVEGDGVTTVRNGAVDPSVKRDGANGYYITPVVDTLQKHANRLKKIAGPWYLPIDRAFSVKGHGCVVTGTMAQVRGFKNSSMTWRRVCRQ